MLLPLYGGLLRPFIFGSLSGHHWPVLGMFLSHYNYNTLDNCCKIIYANISDQFFLYCKFTVYMLCSYCTFPFSFTLLFSCPLLYSRMLQEDLTDEMVVLAKQLKESSLMMSQSLQNTEKVQFLYFYSIPRLNGCMRWWCSLNVSYYSMVRVKEGDCLLIPHFVTVVMLTNVLQDKVC